MEIVIANKSHIVYAKYICDTIAESAKVRGTGIAKRTPEYITSKMENGNAVIALDGDKFAGFCYIEKWGHGKFVANSGLIVHPDYRGQGLGKRFFDWIYNYAKAKGFEAIELNTYVANSPSHKFYFNEGFKILGYHFLKKL